MAEPISDGYQENVRHYDSSAESHSLCTNTTPVVFFIKLFLRTLALAKTSVVVTGQCIGPAANMMSLGEGKRTPCTTNTKPIGTDTCNIQTIYHTVVVGWRRQRAACAHPPTRVGAQ